MPILNMIAQGSGGGWWGSNVWEPTNLSAVATSNTSIDIKWTDNGLQAIPPSTFQKSVLVRKVGSAPTTPSDWTTVVTETVMNTYQSSAYTDTWLTEWTTYYYQVFSYSTDWWITYWTPASATPQWWWQPNPSRTIFYYDFENSSNRLEDTSWNGNNALYASDILYPTVWGQSVAETDSYSWYIQIDWTIGWSIGSGDFAVSFWLYPVDPDSNCPMIFWLYYNDSPYTWPIIFYDPKGLNRQWDVILFRMSWGSASNQHPSTTTASSLYNSWHHIVMTRNSWTVSCYIDWALETSWSGDTEAFPTAYADGYVLSRSVWSSQTFTPWAKWDKFILENVWWSASDVADYYNQTKWIYWL